MRRALAGAALSALLFLLPATPVRATVAPPAPTVAPITDPVRPSTGSSDADTLAVVVVLGLLVLVVTGGQPRTRRRG